MDQLASTHSLVTNDDAMDVLLKSMLQEYDNLVTTLKYGPNPGIISERRKKGGEKEG